MFEKKYNYGILYIMRFVLPPFCFNLYCFCFVLFLVLRCRIAISILWSERWDGIYFIFIYFTGYCSRARIGAPPRLGFGTFHQFEVDMF